MTVQSLTEAYILLRVKAYILQWHKFLQFVAPVSFRLLTRISEFGLDSSCLSRLDDVGLFGFYNYKNSHKMR